MYKSCDEHCVGISQHAEWADAVIGIQSHLTSERDISDHIKVLGSVQLPSNFFNVQMEQPESGFVIGLENWVVPYLNRLEAITANRSRGLFREYLSYLSKVCMALLLEVR